MARIVTKEGIIRDLTRVREDALQMVRDIEWWNLNRTDSPPFDSGSARVTAKLAQDCIDAVVAAEGRIPEEPFDKLVEHAALAAEEDTPDAN